MQKLRNFQSQSGNKGAVDALSRYVYILLPFVPAYANEPEEVVCISAWASALPVLTVMGNAKASARGTE